jgi:hypothetical protein
MSNCPERFEFQCFAARLGILKCVPEGGGIQPSFRFYKNFRLCSGVGPQ